MKPAVHVWLDDERPAPAGWLHCKNADEAKHAFMHHDVQESSLDHDLGPGEDGCHFLKWVHANGLWPKKKPRVHSANPWGHANMVNLIESYGPY